MSWSYLGSTAWEYEMWGLQDEEGEECDCHIRQVRGAMTDRQTGKQTRQPLSTTRSDPSHSEALTPLRGGELSAKLSSSAGFLFYSSFTTLRASPGCSLHHCHYSFLCLLDGCCSYTPSWAGILSLSPSPGQVFVASVDLHLKLLLSLNKKVKLVLCCDDIWKFLCLKWNFLCKWGIFTFVGSPLRSRGYSWGQDFMVYLVKKKKKGVIKDMTNDQDLKICLMIMFLYLSSGYRP